MYYKKIVGEQLYLSPADLESEVDIMTKWVNEDEQIATFNGFYDSLLGKEKVKEKMNKWNEGPFLFSIVNKDTDEFMGHISLFNMGPHELYATMGIYIGKQYRGQGYGKEAIEIMCHYLFETQRYQAIHLEVFEYNTHAYQLYQKLGFKECGRWHNSLYHQGKYHDIIMMELLKGKE